MKLVIWGDEPVLWPREDITRTTRGFLGECDAMERYREESKFDGPVPAEERMPYASFSVDERGQYRHHLKRQVKVQLTETHTRADGSTWTHSQVASGATASNALKTYKHYYANDRGSNVAIDNDIGPTLHLKRAIDRAWGRKVLWCPQEVTL